MASIYISDVMDQIAATIEVQGWEHQFGPPEVMYQDTIITPGYGDYDCSRWLQRALDILSSRMSATPSESQNGAVPMGGAHTISETGDKRV